VGRAHSMFLAPHQNSTNSTASPITRCTYDISTATPLQSLQMR